MNSENVERITLFDERYYKITTENDQVYLPSVTWILNSYPKDIIFNKWLANHGWEESEKIKEEAMDRGSKVHNAIEDMLHGAKLTYATPYYSQRSQENVPLNDNEWKHLISFTNAWNDLQSRLVVTEREVYSLKYGYGGTVDAILEQNGMLIVADWKTSSGIYPTYTMQIAAYIRAIEEMVPELKGVITEGIIIRTNTRHKVGYELVSIKDDAIEENFQNFLSVKKIWEIDNKDKSPINREIPKNLSLEVEKSVIKF